jgi:hypothetical protein
MYENAVQALPTLPNLQFRQQVKVSGSQEFTATLDVLTRKDGSWQAWLAQGDRIRLLDSEKLKLVNQADILQLYSVYVSQPQALIPEVGLNLAAPSGRYRVTEAEQVGLNNAPAIHLKVQPLAEGQLRELWLDPSTALPRQALLFLSGVWGQAYALISFDQVDQYWLPQSNQISLGYGFWVLEGLSRRTFRGSLTISHEYQDYQILPEEKALGFLPSEPPIDRPPTVSGLPVAPTPIEAGDVQSLGQNEAGVEEFSVGIRSQSDETLLGDRITAFNLTRPASRDALTQIDTLALLPLGKAQLPIYLFQFDTGRPIAPIQPARRGSGPDPNAPFGQTPPPVKVFGD